MNMFVRVFCSLFVFTCCRVTYQSVVRFAMLSHSSRWSL